MDFAITYEDAAGQRPGWIDAQPADDIDEAARLAVEHCDGGWFVTRVEQWDKFVEREGDPDRVPVTLEYIPEPNFIPLGYAVGSSELDHDRKLEVVATGPSLYFRIEGERAYVKVDVNTLAKFAVSRLIGGQS